MMRLNWFDLVWLNQRANPHPVILIIAWAWVVARRRRCRRHIPDMD